jgi:hypothetical protein
VPGISKSKLLASLQCTKRFWLEVHHPELREDSAGTTAAFATGQSIGAIAQKLYDPKGRGRLVDVGQEGAAAAIARTRGLLAERRPIFEAGFEAKGSRVFADILLPIRRRGEPTWRMIEVKSTSDVKDYQRDDLAIQAYVARKAGLPLSSVAITHVDTSWVYPGGGIYDGLLIEKDLTEEAFARGKEVKAWIAEAEAIAARRKEPALRTGPHCSDPFECGFFAYCESREKPAKIPVEWLPRIQSKALRDFIEMKQVRDMRRVPNRLLNDLQRRVKEHTLRDRIYFDGDGAAAALSGQRLPACFLDFETINFAIPIWKGIRPYQQIPFQFSLHRLSRARKLEHEAFLDLTGDDPSQGLAEALVAACGDSGPVYAYSAKFEASCLKGLAERCRKLRRPLLAITERLVDLLRIAQDYYYHPDQEGSWSIKSVLPTIAPEVDYSMLNGVKDGGMAMEAYGEAIAPGTTAARREVIRAQLLDYCWHDTYGLVRLWQHFAGRSDMAL